LEEVLWAEVEEVRDLHQAQAKMVGTNWGTRDAFERRAVRESLDTQYGVGGGAAATAPTRQEEEARALTELVQSNYATRDAAQRRASRAGLMGGGDVAAERSVEKEAQLEQVRMMQSNYHTLDAFQRAAARASLTGNAEAVDVAIAAGGARATTGNWRPPSRSGFHERDATKRATTRAQQEA